MKESSACRKNVNLVVTTQQPTTTTEVESAAMNGNSGIALDVSYLPKEVCRIKPGTPYCFEEGRAPKSFVVNHKIV